MVDVTIAHGVGGERLFGNAGADDVVGVVAQKVGNAVTLRHGRGHGARIQLKDVGNGLLFARGQHPGACAGFGHGQNVVRGDAVVPQRRHTQHPEQRIRPPAVEPHHRAQQRHAPGHGLRQPHHQPLGIGHAQAFWEQVGKQDEKGGDDQERGEKARLLRG
ncbi:hypothetical protein D3C72_1838540 [compost metagenome]